MSYQTHSGGVYHIRYHFVWCPKYRRPILVDDIVSCLEKLIHEKVKELGGSVIALEIQPDHVHLLVVVPPKLSPAQIAYRIKGYTSHVLRRRFPKLKSRLPSLWSRSYYVGTLGEVSEEVVKRYIEAQKGR